MNSKTRGALLPVFLLSVWGLPAVVDAQVLCARASGGVRIRENCRAHETPIDLRRLLATDSDAIPLEDWSVPSSPTDGLEAAAASSGSSMTSLAPCRLVDTRPGFSSALPGVDTGAFSDSEIRTYDLTGFCGIPDEASAVSINLAVVPGPSSGFASVGPGGSIPSFPPGPSFASINFVGSGPALSNALVVPLDVLGQLAVYAARSADIIIDTNGYFRTTTARSIYVPGNLSATANGNALRAAVTEANAEAGLSWRIELGPGLFDLGTTGVSLDRPTALQGAGPMSSVITCDCTAPAVVSTDDGSEIRSLRINNTSSTTGNSNAIMINSGNDNIVSDVHITTAGGHGINVIGSSDNILIDSVISDAERRAVAVPGAATVAIQNSTLTSATQSALSVNTGTLTARGSSFHADDDSAINAAQASADVTIEHSTLTSADGSTAVQGSGTFRIRNSFIDAGATSLFGTAICRGIATPSTFLTTTCP